MALSRWGFPNDVGLITRTDQLIQSLSKVTVDIDSTSIETVINDALSDSEGKIIEKINNSTSEIIDAMPECNGCGGMDCCAATKCDIKNAVDNIKQHIDDTVGSQNFQDLFREVSELYNRQ